MEQKHFIKCPANNDHLVQVHKFVNHYTKHCIDFKKKRKQFYICPNNPNHVISDVGNKVNLHKQSCGNKNISTIQKGTEYFEVITRAIQESLKPQNQENCGSRDSKRHRNKEQELQQRDFQNIENAMCKEQSWQELIQEVLQDQDQQNQKRIKKNANGEMLVRQFDQKCSFIEQQEQANENVTQHIEPSYELDEDTIVLKSNDEDDDQKNGQNQHLSLLNNNNTVQKEQEQQQQQPMWKDSEREENNKACQKSQFNLYQAKKNQNSNIQKQLENQQLENLKIPQVVTQLQQQQKINLKNDQQKQISQKQNKKEWWKDDDDVDVEIKRDQNSLQIIKQTGASHNAGYVINKNKNNNNCVQQQQSQTQKIIYIDLSKKKSNCQIDEQEKLNFPGDDPIQNPQQQNKPHEIDFQLKLNDKNPEFQNSQQINLKQCQKSDEYLKKQDKKYGVVSPYKIVRNQERPSFKQNDLELKRNQREIEDDLPNMPASQNSINNVQKQIVNQNQYSSKTKSQNQQQQSQKQQPVTKQGGYQINQNSNNSSNIQNEGDKWWKDNN